MDQVRRRLSEHGWLVAHLFDPRADCVPERHCDTERGRQLLNYDRGG
jgi:hypothetical protein